MNQSTQGMGDGWVDIIVPVAAPAPSPVMIWVAGATLVLVALAWWLIRRRPSTMIHRRLALFWLEIRLSIGIVDPRQSARTLAALLRRSFAVQQLAGLAPSMVDSAAWDHFLLRLHRLGYGPETAVRSEVRELLRQARPLMRVRS